jgi:surface protein
MTFRTNNPGTSASNCIKLPLIPGGTYNFTVNWGDGQSSTITSWNQAETTHCYATAGSYTIGYSGTIQGWSFNNGGDAKKLLSVTKWGPLQLRASGSFWGCSNLTLTGSQDVLDLTGTTNMDSAFRNCSSSSFTTIGNVASWNLSAVTNTYAMFENAWNFNDNIGAWNVSNVTNMANMFSDDRSGYNCMGSTDGMAFNNGGSNTIANWNTANVLSMEGMFEGCKFFNQPIGTWNTGKVSSNSSTLSVSSTNPAGGGSTSINIRNGFERMFSNAWAFNQSLASGSGNTWNVSGGTNTDKGFDRMFNCAKVFNQNLGNWNVSEYQYFGDMFKFAETFNNGGSSTISSWNVSNAWTFESMFNGATVFNQPIGSWTPGASRGDGGVTFSQMFRDARAFNQPIGTWNMAKSWRLYHMFENAWVFNQDISSWNTSNVTNMEGMFQKALAFNQNISGWNTSNVTNMAYMFEGANVFNQNIGGWNVSKLGPGTWNGADKMFSNTTVMNTTNVDALLCGWSTQTVSASVLLDLAALRPSCATGQACKTTLAGKGWTITSGVCI